MALIPLPSHRPTRPPNTRNPENMDYDETATARMIVILSEVPEPQRIDTLAALCRCYIERSDYPQLWGEVPESW